MSQEKRRSCGFLPDLSIRASVPELMDDAHCSRERLLRTIDSFRIVNWLFARYRHVLRHWLLADMLTDPQRTYRVADLGAGGCDIPMWLLRKAAGLGLTISVLAVEVDERIAAYSRNTCRSMQGLEILCQDAKDLKALGPVDYVIGNHFLHHLEYAEIRQLLCQAVSMPLRRFVFTDLLRSYPAFYLHSAVAALLCPGT
ncbi:MAG TPA: methyltransferase domain-containing protein, partial [Phycisphaerae bacterium]|nr:methyltransferase domain-containing protein [Phycisphaerae bacterium]